MPIVTDSWEIESCPRRRGLLVVGQPPVSWDPFYRSVEIRPGQEMEITKNVGNFEQEALTKKKKRQA
jgi:hypothetical protein